MLGKKSCLSFTKWTCCDFSTYKNLSVAKPEKFIGKFVLVTISSPDKRHENQWPNMVSLLVKNRDHLDRIWISWWMRNWEGSIYYVWWWLMFLQLLLLTCIEVFFWWNINHYQQWYFFPSPSLWHPNNQIPSRYLTFPNRDHTCFFFCRSLSLNINTSLSWGTENGFFFGFTTDSTTVNKWKNIYYFYRSSGHLYPSKRALNKTLISACAVI